MSLRASQPPPSADAGSPLLVLGAGAQGRIAAELALRLGHRVAGFLDDTRPPGTAVDGHPVRGPFAAIAEGDTAARHRFVVALGECEARVAWSERVEAAGGGLVSLVHPTAQVSDGATLGRGVFVNAFAAIFPGARCGDHVLVDNHASVGVDVVLGPGTFVGPGAHVNGRARCDAGVFLGSGVIVRPGARIGAGAVVGAGATVVGPLPPACVAVGTPARALPRSDADAPARADRAALRQAR